MMGMLAKETLRNWHRDILSVSVAIVALLAISVSSGCMKKPVAEYESVDGPEVRLEKERHVEEALFSAFQQEAAAWRALPAKPVMLEDAYRFKVLAEDALQEKDFAGALDYYEQGLAAAPLWPDGRFNAALICGELKQYSRAVHHMKRYLALAPEASDAPAARDKLIIWKEKVRKAATKYEEDMEDAEDEEEPFRKKPMTKPSKSK